MDLLSAATASSFPAPPHLLLLLPLCLAFILCNQIPSVVGVSAHLDIFPFLLLPLLLQTLLPTPVLLAPARSAAGADART